MKAKIKRLNKDIELPAYKTKESAGFDIASNVDVVVGPGQIEKIRTGLIIESPEGYFLTIAARSSLAFKMGLMLANGIGVIDRDYSGPKDELLISIYNFSEKEVKISRGDRLAQGLFFPVNQVEWEDVEEIREGSRGGYGTTGGYSS